MHVEADKKICTFMKLMLSDLWKNICTELRSFSASRRFSLSCRTCWEFFLTYMPKVFPSICTVSAWFASSSACILWYWALTRSFNSDTVSYRERRACRLAHLNTHAHTLTATYFTCQTEFSQQWNKSQPLKNTCIISVAPIHLLGVLWECNIWMLHDILQFINI